MRDLVPHQRENEREGQRDENGAQELGAGGYLARRRNDRAGQERLQEQVPRYALAASCLNVRASPATSARLVSRRASRPWPCGEPGSRWELPASSRGISAGCGVA